MAYTAAGAPNVKGGLRGAMKRGNEGSMLRAMAARLNPRGHFRTAGVKMTALRAPTAMRTGTIATRGARGGFGSTTQRKKRTGPITKSQSASGTFKARVR